MRTGMFLAALTAALLSIPDAVAEDDMMMKDPPAGGMQGGMQGRSSGGMSGMRGMGGMMRGMMGGMGGMGGGAMPDNGMGAPMQSPGMEMMGRMRGGMQTQGMSGSALPGFPGASHLYHVGATGFFLDHPQHITLSTQQQTALNRIKEKAGLDRATAERRIEDAEQELWTLTAADQPDVAKVEAQIRAIEKLRGDLRLNFIRAVGEAAMVLTPEQRGAVLGTQPPAPKKPAAKPAPMAPGAPMQHK